MASVTTKKLPAFEILLSEKEALELREVLEYLYGQAAPVRYLRKGSLMDYLLDNLPEA